LTPGFKRLNPCLPFANKGESDMPDSRLPGFEKSCGFGPLLYESSFKVAQPPSFTV